MNMLGVPKYTVNSQHGKMKGKQKGENMHDNLKKQEKGG
jgi:hypothetical protein